MLLLLVRHARAEEVARSGHDADRVLTADGIERFTAAAQRLATVLAAPPQRWLVSPYRRAQQTADILRAALGHAGRIETAPELVPNADPLAVLERLATPAASSAVLVGHEPHLGYLLGHLLTGAPGQSVPLKKGMAVAVEVDHVGSAPGQLVFALSQRTATLLGD